MLERRQRLAGRLGDVLALCLFTLLLYVPALGARDLWNPNEPIYGQAVVEMAQAGDWSTPRVNGEAFYEKPILYFWLARVIALLTGTVNEFSLRLPSALAGVAGVLLTYLLIRPYATRHRSLLGAAMFATTYVVFWTARWVQMDLLLSVCVLLFMLAMMRVSQAETGAYRWWSIAGVALAAGCLTKGPVMLLLTLVPFGVYAAFEGQLSRLWRDRRGLLTVGLTCAGLLSFWIIPLLVRGDSEYLREILVRQTLMRPLQAWDHQQPWWYYLREFWSDMAPWSLFVPLALVGHDATSDGERRLRRLAWIWLISTVVLFSLSASKRSPYIMPVAPAVAILASGFVITPSPARARWGLGIVTGLGLLLGVASIVAYQHVLPKYPDLRGVGVVVCLVLFVAGLILAASVGVSLRRLRLLPAVWTLVVVLFGLVNLVAVGLLPRLDRYKSPREFCTEVNRLVAPGQPLFAYRTWKWRAGYTYFTGRQIPRLESLSELREYWSRPEAVFLIVERGRLAEAREILGSRRPLVRKSIGSNEAYLFTNRSSSGAKPKSQTLRVNRAPSSFHDCGPSCLPTNVVGWPQGMALAAAATRERGHDRPESVDRVGPTVEPTQPAPCAAGSSRKTPRSRRQAQATGFDLAAGSPSTGR